VTEPVRGQVAEVPAAANPRAGSRYIPVEPHGLPVLGDYDVVVVGGGTGGAPAGIGAGRQGARTLVLEHLYGLGGVGTLGLISSYYHGNRVGFTKRWTTGWWAFARTTRASNSANWNPEHKIECTGAPCAAPAWIFGTARSAPAPLVDQGRVTGRLSWSPLTDAASCSPKSSY